jgi:hypothetical protein
MLNAHYVEKLYHLLMPKICTLSKGVVCDIDIRKIIVMQVVMAVMLLLIEIINNILFL